MNPADIRRKFLEFFARNEHQIVQSSSVIPAQDPTLLFANAGMNQFKDIFLGNEVRPYKRATTSQKCVRAGGKHNDLDQVGFTRRHLTFFEMLGNFSFGSYFKEQAIKFAWEFLTKDLGINPDLLSATVHLSDDDAERIWLEQIGLPKSRVSRKGDADNFWQMGDTGPCGPCSEIFYDRGAQFDYQGEDERFVEIWNMVFMQYNRQADGKLLPLQQCGVDTGMGFERLVMVLAGADSIFTTDVFAPFRSKITAQTKIAYDTANDKIKVAFNVLSDHIRSTSFIIADGAKPSNDGRGYVLRKIIRRALLFSRKLSNDKNLFVSLVPELVAQMSDVYPELARMQGTIENVLREETERFFSNLEKGERIFAEFISTPEVQQSKKLSGQKAFMLYDTYGFPLEITRILAMDAGIDVDLADFEKFMEQQRALSEKGKKAATAVDLPANLQSEFVGYSTTKANSTINWIDATQAEAGTFWICTVQSPFFAARGGQVSDNGKVKFEGKSFPVVEVQELATSPHTKAIILRLQGQPDALRIDQSVDLEVDEKLRMDTAKNHTATHLLHAALRIVLGSHATQAGSLVEPDYLRFDFGHDKALTSDEIAQVEVLVNDWVAKNMASKILNTTLPEAQKLGADAIFGEKYNPEMVRVVDYGGVSVELCGGTHLAHTGSVGLFKIISDESMGVGIRRIVALTGSKALELCQSNFALTKSLAQRFSCKQHQVAEVMQKHLEKLTLLEKEAEGLRKKLLLAQVNDLAATQLLLPQGKFLYAQMPAEQGGLLREMAQLLTEKLPDACVFLYSMQADDKVSFICLVGPKATHIFDLKKMQTFLAEHGMRAGGTSSSLQGGVMGKKMTNMQDDIITFIKQAYFTKD